MDRLDTLLVNARDRLGCSGLRNLHDLGQMRQETLEKRTAAAQHRLTVRNTLSIYTAWLWERAFSIAPKNLSLVIEKWCLYLWGIGCTREMARASWTEAQAMLGPFLATRPPSPGAVHMKIGSSITNQFPTAAIAKRKLDVLEDGACPDELRVDDKTRGDALPPSAKRQKASHTVQRIAAPSMYQSLPLLPPYALIDREEFLSLSPRNGEKSMRSIDSVARRAKTENDAKRPREDFRFNFRSTPPKRSVGASHWSPRKRQAEDQTFEQTHKQPVQLKMEERSPTPPPRAVSVRRAPVQHALQVQTQTQTPTQKQKQKQTEKQNQSWQINNVQNHILKHAKTASKKPKAPGVLKVPEGWAKDELDAKWGQSSMMAEAERRERQTFSRWPANESGRLSPWEEEDTTFQIQGQAGTQTKQDKAPLPLRPITLGQPARGAMNMPLSHFGTPEGVFKPTNNEMELPHQTCVPSALTLPMQSNEDYHAQFHAHLHRSILPQHYSQQYAQHYSQQLAQHFAQHVRQQLAPPPAQNPNSRARVAPYPKMHNSPVLQHSIPVQRQEVTKPVVGYHPSVTRLFTRRANVQVHQTNRDVALDTWGDFSDANQPQEYWAWEEYDPFRPIVYDVNERVRDPALGV